ncbi:MAG: S1-like domain-containing RNA-binding protein [Luteolibacter sp.]
MAVIGERTPLEILREKTFGLYLDGGALGEVLLPHREVPANWQSGDFLDVFLYTDSEDRPVATLAVPKVMPGKFARLKCISVSNFGAFLDWGLPKDLFVPFREQKIRMQAGHSYLVFVMVDQETQRIIATSRITRHLDLEPQNYQVGQQVDLIAFAKTELGYKAIIDHTHSGLLYANEVYQKLQPGEQFKGYITALREDGKIDLSLHAPGRARVDDLESQILAELEARGGFWNLSDSSPAEEIQDELGVSKRTFKQALGALLKKGKIRIEPNGTRRIEES